jgi:hypothetical protein
MKIKVNVDGKKINLEAYIRELCDTLEDEKLIKLYNYIEDISFMIILVTPLIRY